MTKSIKIEDLLKFRFLSNLFFNPSGTAYAYQLANVDKEKDSYFNTVYVNKKAYKADKSTSILNWYDDHNLIITEKEKKEPLINKYYLLNIENGKRKLFFSTPLKVTSLEVVDKNTLLLSAYISVSLPDLYKADKKELEKIKEKKKKEADYEVLDEIPYWFNGSGFINKLRPALFICELKPFRIERITALTLSAFNAKVNERTIYFTGKDYDRFAPKYDRLYKYDLNTNKTACLYDRDDQIISAIYCLNNDLYVLASDGKKYGLNESSKFHILKDKELVQLPTPDRSLYDAVATDTTLGSGKGMVVKNGYLYTLLTEKDHVELWQFDSECRYKKLLEMPLITFFDVSKDRIIFCGSDDTSLPELYEYSFRDKKVKLITSFNKGVLKDKYVAKPEEINYISQDLKLNGWVLFPKDYDPKKKYPAVLDIHGGPRAIYSRAFFHEMQVWASQGYFVLFTNIRGSDGRGDEFADIRGKYGEIDYLNLMDFTDTVLKKYKAIDKTKLCETGGSYGGFMTNWIIGHTDRFCCTASQRSIANWTGFTYLSDIGYQFCPDQNATDEPIRDYDKLWDHSPLKYVDNVKTPTLFIHSDQDYRCPLPEGMQMMQALAHRNVETRLVVFHGENHELSRSGKPSHRIRRLSEITEWFNKHTR